MAGLLHDGEFGGAVQVGLGGETGAEAVAGVSGRIEAGAGDGAFDDGADRVFVQGLRVDAAMAVDFTKDRAGLDRGGSQPIFVGVDRARFGAGPDGDRERSSLAFLVGLRPAQADHQAIRFAGDVLDRQRGQFGASEAAGETDQQ